MAIIGFNYSKFDCERKAVEGKGNIDINHNISIKNVEKSSLNVGGTKNEVLKIDFGFDVVYGNNLGKISILGEVIYTDTREIISEVFNGWQTDKKLNAIVNEQVFRFVYGKATVKALELADSLNLPSPIPLPQINFAPNTADTQGTSVKGPTTPVVKKK